MLNNRLDFKLASLSTLQDDKSFASLAEKYPAKQGVSYIGFTFHASAPLINMKGMSITPATMKASLESAIHCMVDFEHRAEDIPIPREDDENGTDVVGHIIELAFGDIPSLEDKDAWLFHPYIPKEPIITRGVMAFFTRISRVRRIATEVQGGATWYFSLEIGNDVTPPAIWLKANNDAPDEIIPWADATEDLRLIAGKPEMMEYNGRQVGYLMGGAAGQIAFIGGAVTRNPAGLEQRQPGHALMFIASADGDIMDVKSTKKISSEDLRKRLKTGKEGRNASVDIVLPINIDNCDELLDMYYAVNEIANNPSSDTDNTGGEKKVEITQEKLDSMIKEAVDKGVAEAKKAAFDEGKAAGLGEAVDPAAVLEKAVTDGTHIPAEKVDGIVAERMLSKGRIAAIGALACDDDMKADFMALAGNIERYPLDEEGEKLFQATHARWKASLKPVKKTDGDKEPGEDDKGADGKKTSSTGTEGSGFDPGNGGGNDNEDPPEDIPIVR